LIEGRGHGSKIVRAQGVLVLALLRDAVAVRTACGDGARAEFDHDFVVVHVFGDERRVHRLTVFRADHHLLLLLTGHIF
jgi:hypothetical protein